jgi:hypothetical protein
MNYPKAFEKYWRRAEQMPAYGLVPYLYEQFKRTCYLAWLAGRRYQRSITRD